MEQSWLDYVHFVQTLAKVQVELATIALAGFIWAWKKQKIEPSILITLGVWVFVNYVMRRISPIYLELALNGYKEEIRQVWYPTWILFYALSIGIIVIAHRWIGVSFTFYSRFIAAICLYLCVVQTSRYIERFVVGTEYLAGLYKYSMPVMETVVLICTWSLLVYSLFSSRPRGVGVNR